jgi:putative flippase GtrA
MVKAAAFDIREFARFFATGVAATAANVTAVWAARLMLPFEGALLVGIAVGSITSFVLSKLFAFESRSWHQARGEAVRFLFVYAVGCAIYWYVAIVSRGFFIAHGVPPQIAELMAAVVGAGMMLVTSYFGHRFITFRSHRRMARLG